VYHAKAAFSRPVSYQDNKNSQERVYDEMKQCETQVNHRVSSLCFLVMHMDQRDGAFDHPEKNHGSDKNSHSFKWPLF
jgi:hypothetical protein